eukprot:1196305-Prorocentrum_minimum.AAC.3
MPRSVPSILTSRKLRAARKCGGTKSKTATSRYCELGICCILLRCQEGATLLAKCIPCCFSAQWHSTRTKTHPTHREFTPSGPEPKITTLAGHSVCAGEGRDLPGAALCDQKGAPRIRHRRSNPLAAQPRVVTKCPHKRTVGSVPNLAQPALSHKRTQCSLLTLKNKKVSDVSTLRSEEADSRRVGVNSRWVGVNSRWVGVNSRWEGLNSQDAARSERAASPRSSRAGERTTSPRREASSAASPRLGREHIPVAGTNRGRGERISHRPVSDSASALGLDTDTVLVQRGSGGGPEGVRRGSGGSPEGVRRGSPVVDDVRDLDVGNLRLLERLQLVFLVQESGGPPSIVKPYLLT